jgi:outer membrane protein OmpA-like peptidoglycan-associated protein
VTAREIRIELAADVLFDFDKAELRADALDALRKVATVIASTPGPVVIEGHTDSKGEDPYNHTLSERRASSVKTWLAREGGIDAARISTRGLGETQPKVPNAAPTAATTRPAASRTGAWRSRSRSRLERRRPCAWHAPSTPRRSARRPRDGQW